ncbi:MAG: hypothetical protein V4633_04345 [Pseudomonadota bacterium]
MIESRILVLESGDFVMLSRDFVALSGTSVRYRAFSRFQENDYPDLPQAALHILN